MIADMLESSHGRTEGRSEFRGHENYAVKRKCAFLGSVLSVLEMAVGTGLRSPNVGEGRFAVEPLAQGTTDREPTGRQIAFQPRKNFLAMRESVFHRCGGQG